ncbi:hypothetical protein MPTK1_Vg01000 [Marchantia polymorpha subsp. ruderalis]|uniref:Serine-threonine/tyrosine-protein kinase catalytic domain-containing protein n=1 Tax=Marchantia polymorpha TaxID=3197 RepID=A0A2R6VX14_MARPO|nr:hypothetical protein MARPO_YA0022 [Marchantia polymorpha]BBN20631.1 hypothetical protein Mp_Vg01000 [Marchantia polymorpha subsp. ruderalis]|eukprot:PTQ26142.1 hypothetical protein MARPO_YA0022 [Marchantia polymorpha]
MDNTWTAIFHIAKSNSGPPIPTSVSSSLHEFLSLCFKVNPGHRPTASQISKIFILKCAKRLQGEKKTKKEEIADER